MNTIDLSHGRNWHLSIALIMISLLQHSCAAQENRDPVPPERMEEIKQVYGFNEWVGRVKVPERAIRTLSIDPNFLDVVSSETTVFTPEQRRAKELGLAMIDANTGLNVDVHITAASDPLTAHTSIIRFLSLVTFPPPVYRRVDPNDPNDPLNIGDVCFVPIRPWIPEKSKEPVIRTLLFCRDNVFVVLRNSGDETKEVYPDIEQIARLIDQRLQALAKPRE